MLLNNYDITAAPENWNNDHKEACQQEALMSVLAVRSVLKQPQPTKILMAGSFLPTMVLSSKNRHGPIDYLGKGRGSEQKYRLAIPTVQHATTTSK
jgi:hypothetical protein